MASSDDTTSRFSSALDEVFAGGLPKQASEQSEPVPEATKQPEPVAEAAAEPVVEPPTQQIDQEPTADRTVDDEPASEQPAAEPQPVALPTIIPATVHTPVADPAPAAPAPIPPTRTPPTRTPAAAPSAPTVAPTPAQPRQVAAAPASAPPKPVTGWGDHMGTAPTAPVSANLRAPGRRPRVRKVTRVLRHIDPWSTFKVALLFSLVAYVVTLTSGVLLWRVADSTGTLDNVERWFTQFGWETFELKGGEIFHNAWIIGLFGAVALTGALVLLATLFNLVSDIVGGVRMTVLEEEVVERTVSSTRRYVVRRSPVDGGAPGQSSAADWDVDADDEPEPSGATPTAAAASGDGIAEHPAADWSVDDD